MVFTTAGEMNQRPVAAERVLDILHAITLLQCAGKDLGAPEDLIAKIIEEVQALPTMKLPDGKQLAKKRYPRIMVIDSAYPEDGVRRIGDNAHEYLAIRKRNGGAYIAFVDMQSLASTDHIGTGYTFVGDYDDDERELHVPFDTVWVEEGNE